MAKARLRNAAEGIRHLRHLNAETRPSQSQIRSRGGAGKRQAPTGQAELQCLHMGRLIESSYVL